MKRITNFFLGASLLAVAVAATSCGEPFDSYNKISPVDANAAGIKFIQAAPTYANGLEVLVNGTRVSGVATAPPAVPNSIKYGNIFPLTEYVRVPSGTAKVQWNVTGTSEAFLTKDVPLAAGKYYTQFVIGSSPYDLLTVQDDFPGITTEKVFYIRVINLVPNSTTAQFTYDGKPLDTPKAYAKTDGAFIKVPIEDYSSGRMSKSVGVSISGGVAPVTGTLTISAVAPGAVYTLFTRGMVTTDAKNPTKFAPTLVAFVHR